MGCFLRFPAPITYRPLQPAAAKNSRHLSDALHSRVAVRDIVPDRGALVTVLTAVDISPTPQSSHHPFTYFSGAKKMGLAGSTS